MNRRLLGRGLLALAGVLVLGAVLLRAGMTRSWVEGLLDQGPARPVQLRIWDWWSPSTNEEYGAYFAAVERTFEARHPDIDLVYQTVPFGNYVQKLSTAMVGRTPPDVFQSSVYWAEGFYQRGMLRPLDDLLERNRQQAPPHRVGEEAFLPSAWRHNQAADGTVFGIPQIIDAQCLLWNLDILQRAAQTDAELAALFSRHPDGSIDYDHIRFDGVRDWEHFRRLVKKLTRQGDDGQLQQAGFVINAYGGGAGMFSPWMAANGGRYQDAAGTRALFSTPNGVEAMRFIAQLYWEDKVCPPFRRQIADAELFQEGEVACMVAGTWSGKDIVRNTMGWDHFGKTAFPPGPRGSAQKTVTWGNMLVITERCRNVEAAWAYIRFVCGLEGNLLRLEHLGYNGPRLDFYETPQWRQAMAERSYLSNVKEICLAGDKLRHTEIIATNHQANPIIETVLLRYPDIVAGEGPYASVEAALKVAAGQVDNVYRRYNRQVAQWLAQREEGP
ncbi:MAG: extracellular solute-binding protein [Candidatus Latescibacteria bacterium]|nr:extracellular solute-binding protein [Candidatus Latescibacterota bacterium]